MHLMYWIYLLTYQQMKLRDPQNLDNMLTWVPCHERLIDNILIEFLLFQV